METYKVNEFKSKQTDKPNVFIGFGKSVNTKGKQVEAHKIG